MKKNPRQDLRKYHLIFTQIGIICSLLFLIAATKINQKEVGYTNSNITTDNTPIVIDLPPIIPPKKLPPQKPMIFTEKPDDQVLEIEIPEFPEFGDLTNKIILPPKPAPDSDDEPITFLPEMPKIIGGQKALYSNIKYPKQAKNLGIEGRVHVQFIIDKQGNVTDPEIIRGVHPDLDAEVLRVIKLVKFSPGVQNGVLVRVKMVQSVNFILKR